MNNYTYITLCERPELKARAAEWFNSKWGVPTQAYISCMDGDNIVGGLGVIANDFHDRKDLTPNICAVYTEKEHRGRGIAGRLLNNAVEDLKSKGISPVWLVTDHTSFYERYGWEYLCEVHCDGEPNTSRMYIHR